jgi:hypothetical protein
MRVPEEPVCIDLFRQNPVFTSLHLKYPVHVVPPLLWSPNRKQKTLFFPQQIVDTNVLFKKYWFVFGKIKCISESDLWYKTCTKKKKKMKTGQCNKYLKPTTLTVQTVQTHLCCHSTQQNNCTCTTLLFFFITKQNHITQTMYTKHALSSIFLMH